VTTKLGAIHGQSRLTPLNGLRDSAQFRHQAVHKMGEPYLQIKQKLKQHGIVAFFELRALGDMSQRLEGVIESLVPTR
jgi:hypothetical protein